MSAADLGFIFLHRKNCCL